MPKISDLPALVTLNLTDEAAFNVSGVTKRGAVSTYAAAIESGIDHLSIQNIGANSHVTIDAHLANLANPHVVTKTQVGLSNVENLKVNLTAVVAPAVGNDNTEGYAVGSRWIDTVLDNEFVAVDVTTGAAVWIATTSVAKGVVTFAPASNTSAARTPYPTRAAGSTAQTYFPLTIPENFTSMDSVKIYGIAGATDTGLDIDVIINFADPTSEAYNANSASDTASTFSTTVDEFLILDITSIFSGVSIGDQVGINVDHNGIGQTIYYTQGVLVYNRF